MTIEELIKELQKYPPESVLQAFDGGDPDLCIINPLDHHELIVILDGGLK